MDGIISLVIQSIRSLELEKRLSPKRNPNIAWFYVFLPAFFGYIVLLTQYLNAKPHIGTIEIFNSAFGGLVSRSSHMEIIVNNSEWADGPLWVDDESSSSGYLLFSDTKLNNIYKWEEGKGLFTIGKFRFHARSGCKLNSSHCDSLLDPGSNGLIQPLAIHYPPNAPTSVDFIACQMGERAITFFRENGTRTVIASHFKGRRFNSPNDLVMSPEGHLYFTDPPFGLYNRSNHIIDRQLPFSGVYMIRVDAVRQSIQSGIPVDGDKDIRLIQKDIRRPNGLAFSPDYSKLYISNSEISNACWTVYDVTDSGGLTNGRVFYNASEHSQLLGQGLPNGLKVDLFGNVFASGPGGVLVLNADGLLLGRLTLDRPVSNLVITASGMMYLTAGDLVIRLKTLTKPVRILSK